MVERDERLGSASGWCDVRPGRPGSSPSGPRRSGSLDRCVSPSERRPTSPSIAGPHETAGGEALPNGTTKTSSAGRTQAAAPRPREIQGRKAADTRSSQARRASILLKHVSDPTRLQVILILAEGEQHVGALCAQLSQSQPAVSHHLALLRHGGIIAPRRQGKNNFYSLTETGTEPVQGRQGPDDGLIDSGRAEADADPSPETGGRLARRPARADQGRIRCPSAVLMSSIARRSRTRLSR